MIKYFEDRLKRINESCVLVERGKHETSYYLPAHWGGAIAIYRHIFNERDKTGWFYHYPEVKKPVRPDPLPETVTDPKIISYHNSLSREFNKNLRRYNEEKIDRELYEAAKNNDEALIEFMEMRNSFEYEEILTEDLIKPKGLKNDKAHIREESGGR